MLRGFDAISIRVYAVLLLLLGASWWWSRAVEPVEENLLTLSGQQIDYFAEQITISEMNEEGVLKHQLVADHMTHYTNDARSQLQNPVIMLYDPPHQPWRVSALAGTVFAGGDRIVLEGDVYISRDAGDKELPVEIRTEWLEILTDQSSAYTDKKIDMVSRFDRIEGIGMKIQFDSNLLVSILSKARSRHEGL